jgi:hypothetical protein
MMRRADIECAVRQLHARYADAVWRKDYVAFAECFEVNAEWRISGMILQGRSQIVAAIEQLMGNFQRVVMSFHSPLLHLAGDSIWARTHSVEQYAMASGPAGAALGTYYERFSRSDDDVQFSWRLFELNYMGPADLSGTFFRNPDYGAPPAMPPLDAVPANHSGLGTTSQTAV